MKTRWLLLLVGAAALLVHLPAQDGEFLFYDDGRFVVRNTSIDRVGNPARFFTDLETTASAESRTRDIYRPVRTLSYALIVRVWGKDARAFHRVAIVLHAVCAVLLALLLLRAGCGRGAAAAGALLFALHPVTVEVTAWVCSLGDLWCGVFALLAMLAYASDRLGWAYVALVAALFSKEHAVVVPGLWLAWDFFFRRERLRAAPIARGAGAGLLVVLAFLVFRGVVAGAHLSQVPEPLGGSHKAAVWTMMSGLGWYAATLLFPYGSTFNARVAIQETPFALPVLAGLAVLALLGRALFRGPARTRFAAAWFLMALVPVSNVFVPLKIPTADRFLYLPLMGLAFAAAELCARVPRVAVRAAPVVLLLLAALTFDRIGDWRDDNALIEAGRRVNPKDKALLWAEAALSAKRAVEEIRAGDPERGLALAGGAGDLYRKYLQNARPWERTQVHLELGELWWTIAEWAQRVDHPELTNAWSRSLESYLAAHKLQVAGVGRVIEEEVIHAGERIVRLCILLARPTNPGVDRAVSQGLATLQFLEKHYGRWPGLEATQLVLLRTIRHRTKDPAAARVQFTRILDMLDAVDERGQWTTYMRAQVYAYRSILKDRPFDREGLEKAYALYRRAAEERPGFKLQALLYAGRTCCHIGRLFKDEEWLVRGQELLDSLPDMAAQSRVPVGEYWKRELLTIREGCR